ncbi:MAG: glycoside hydrolase family 3 C-terminal domain-containing protein [Phycisphaeraceae bacterium]
MTTETVQTYQNPELDVDTRTRDLLDRMTLEEKAAMLTGRDFWHLEPIERLGVPALRCSDGGHGVTVTGDVIGPATCFPTGITQAATWNPQLIERAAAAMAREARARKNAVFLAPMINIHRTPVNGRNYETYSEDPYLVGRMATAFCQGVQSQRVAACIKALAANNQQKAQHKTSAELDERTLREIYLPGFEMAVKEAKPWSMMTSYNLLNGTYTSEHEHLLRDIAKNEWGFEGFIVSDWRATTSMQSFHAGLDLEMPGPGKIMTRAAVVAGINAGELSETELDDKVLRILRAIVRSGLIDVPQPELPSELDSPRHRALAREVAEEAVVLLKNDNRVLPLDASRIKRLAVIGPNARVARIGGGGSASVTPFYTVSPYEGLKNHLPDHVELVYEEGCSLLGGLEGITSEHLLTSDDKPGLDAAYFPKHDLNATPGLTRTDGEVDFSWGWNAPGENMPKNDWAARWTGYLNVPTAGDYKLGGSFQDGACRLYIAGALVLDAWEVDDEKNFEARYRAQSRSIEQHFEEAGRVPIRLEYRKIGNKAAMRLEWQTPFGGDTIAKAVAAASSADAAVLFVGISNTFEGGTHDREQFELPQAQTDLINAVAKANANAAVVLFNGTPIGMEPWLASVPALIEAWYPGQEGGNALARILLGEVNPSGRLPDTLPRRLEDNPTHDERRYPGVDGKALYEEGVFVGYRHYDKHDIQPSFPFGFGLSYTRFAYDNLRLASKTMRPRETVDVQVDVTNTGDRAGSDVVQLYVGDVEASVPRPVRELKGFEKITLDPGETKTVTLRLTERDLAFYDVDKPGWRVEPGEFTVQVGPHSREGLTTTLRYAP